MSQIRSLAQPSAEGPGIDAVRADPDLSQNWDKNPRLSGAVDSLPPILDQMSGPIRLRPVS